MERLSQSRTKNLCSAAIQRSCTILLSILLCSAGSGWTSCSKDNLGSLLSNKRLRQCPWLPTPQSTDIFQLHGNLFGQAAFLPSPRFLPHTAPGASLALAPLAWADRAGAGAALSVRWRWDDLGSVWGETDVPHKLPKDLREQAGQRRAVKQNKGNPGHVWSAKILDWFNTVPHAGFSTAKLNQTRFQVRGHTDGPQLLDAMLWYVMPMTSHMVSGCSWSTTFIWPCGVMCFWYCSCSCRLITCCLTLFMLRQLCSRRHTHLPLLYAGVGWGWKGFGWGGRV